MSIKTAQDRPLGARKFMFDTTFDMNEDIDGPRKPPTFSEADVAAVRQEAYAEGQQAGRAEVIQGLEQACELALKTIAGSLENLLSQHAALTEDITQKSLTATAAVCRKVLPIMSQRHALREIEGFIVECLGLVIEEPRVVVRVPDKLLEKMREKIDALASGHGFAGKVVLLGDDAMGPDDCAVLWADGGAEKNGARLWDEVNEAIDRRLKDSGQASVIQAPPNEC